MGLLIGAGVVYAAAPSIGLTGTTATTTVGGGTATATTTVSGGTVTKTVTGAGAGLCNGQTITIGALFDLTGQLSNLGRRSKAASDLALADVNAFLASSGCNLKFQVNVNDYALDNNKALQQVQAMAAQGVSTVIGPFNSGTAQFILSYINSNHIAMISPSSTSPALAIANDYLFRTAPNDAAQGLAVARILVERGVNAVIVLNRHDTYGDGLANSTAARFTALGGTVVDKIAYDTATTDFTPILTKVNSDWQTASTQYGADKVAILAISFEEIGTMLIQAQAQFPALLSTPQPWYGSDGTAQNGVITSASTSGPYVAQVKLPSTIFNVANNSKTISFFSRYVTALPGQACEFYCLEVYNDVWLAALSILSAGKNDGTLVQKALPTVAANFYGLTGWEGLQDSGDRIPGAYQVWKVVSQGAGFTWVLAGTWDYNSDTITWTSPP